MWGIEFHPETEVKEEKRGPTHYSKYAIEPADFIAKNKLDYFQGNVIKYIVRFRDKDGKKDLLKIKHYVDMLIENEYADK